ncbi:hypothetical protein NQZ68_014677, partial [Dissostichus eleginoides]
MDIQAESGVSLQKRTGGRKEKTSGLVPTDIDKNLSCVWLGAEFSPNIVQRKIKVMEDNGQRRHIMQDAGSAPGVESIQSRHEGKVLYHGACEGVGQPTRNGRDQSAREQHRE